MKKTSTPRWMNSGARVADKTEKKKHSQLEKATGAGLNDDRTEAVIREIKEGKIKNKNSPPQTSRHIYPIGLFFIHLPVPLFFS